jgi:hypothetical protein
MSNRCVREAIDGVYSPVFWQTPTRGRGTIEAETKP